MCQAVFGSRCFDFIFQPSFHRQKVLQRSFFTLSIFVLVPVIKIVNWCRIVTNIVVTTFSLANKDIASFSRRQHLLLHQHDKGAEDVHPYRLWWHRLQLCSQPPMETFNKQEYAMFSLSGSSKSTQSFCFSITDANYEAIVPHHPLWCSFSGNSSSPVALGAWTCCSFVRHLQQRHQHQWMPRTEPDIWRQQIKKAN